MLTNLKINVQKTKITPTLIAKVAMMGVLSYVVMLLEFALPFFPSFLKLDLSDIFPLIGSFALGPVAGMLIEFVKCALHWATVSTTGGVGDLANFIVGSAFVMSAGAYYGRRHTKIGAIISLCIGTAAMIIAGALMNYYVMVPFYGAVFFKDAGGVDAVVAMGSAVIPAIHDKFTLILYSFCPFNLLKGVVISIIALPLYKRVSPLIKAELRKNKTITEQK
ncbi:MAG: ECF transporter S component [Oscillospiraceae bacterium]